MPVTLGFNIVTGAAMSALHRMLETECRDDFSDLAAAVALRALGVEDAAADAISKVAAECQRRPIRRALSRKRLAVWRNRVVAH